MAFSEHFVAPCRGTLNVLRQHSVVQPATPPSIQVGACSPLRGQAPLHLDDPAAAASQVCTEPHWLTGPIATEQRLST